MFADRGDAAIQLAEALKKYKDVHALVLGIPRGGAVTAYYVATALHADFSLIISRKLGHPMNPEFAIGAIAEDGSVHVNPYAEAEVSPQQMDEMVAQQKKEIERRIKVLRKGEPLPSLRGRIVILVDDGIATGATLMAAIKMCRNQSAAKIVVAAPVSGGDMEAKLMNLVDDVVILEKPDFFHAVSQAYESFYQVSDDEAVALLEKWNQENGAALHHML